jgi:hypothetical protein
MYIWWGPEGACLYNDAYRQSIGSERHPSSLGRPAREVWGEIWDIIGWQIEQVMSGRGSTWHENALVPITRNGKTEDVYWTYSYSPIDDEAAAHGVGGVLVVCAETTDTVLLAPNGGRLTLETANKSLDDRDAKERDLPRGQYICLCVTDTGSGMEAAIIERAFDPFFTTKPLGDGTGLGLSMVYGFARQSGGQVQLKSEVGKGTTMCIYLPRHMGATEEARSVRRDCGFRRARQRRDRADRERLRATGSQ